MTRPLLTGILLLALGACATNRPARPLGDLSGISPRIELIQGEMPPRHLTFTLAHSASVAVMYVVPGQGAMLIYPSDTLEKSAPLEAGEHTVLANFARLQSPLRADSARKPAADSAKKKAGRARDFGAGGPGVLGAGWSREEEGRLGPTGYLLLVATDAPMDPRTIRQKLAGVTIPLPEDDALNSVGKLVRSSTGSNVAWAGVAKPVKVSTAPDRAAQNRTPRPR
ncbi:MAG: hypothetical protein JWO05_1581 [Gemmatimonadetes bacterium]|nr:hypothetical protein [Gemmatimonadota bacterium]